MSKFQIFRLNLAELFLERFYFSNKFSIIFDFVDLKFSWFGQIVVLQTNYDDIELKNSVTTSF